MMPAGWLQKFREFITSFPTGGEQELISFSASVPSKLKTTVSDKIYLTALACAAEDRTREQRKGRLGRYKG